MPNNSLHGHIPNELGHLFRLKYINLRLNYLEGTIPSSLSDELPFLNVLDLSGNKLVGSIPPLLANSSSLNVLSLSGNRLTGSIPTSLGSSLSLAYLDLSNNSLTGNIPHSLGNSTSLQILVLSRNNLSEEIPPSLGNNPSLHHLDLAFNSLRGVIPPFSSPLYFLGLSSNQLSGRIPPSLGNISSLLYLFLADNHLEGSIPSKLGNIPKLQELDLTINNLSGTVPSSLYNLSSVSYFGLGNNRLYGELPPDIGITLPKLQHLIMQGNQFHGPIPASICNASELQTLNLAVNSFNGLVPSNLGSLPNLQVLNIGWNQLQAHDWGFLSSLSNCSLLEKLYLQENKLKGILPKSVGNLSTRLQLLMIGMNQISGSIPAEIGNLVNLQVLYVDQNHLMGNIPATIGNLQNLLVLNLSSNQISGPIPFSIGKLTQLNEVYMQNNELSGPIPASFGSYRYLNALNLSHNTLSGSIPKEIVEIASLTRFLDLSHNSLTGSLPEEVGSLINLGHLDVSENQLSGEIPHSLGDCQLLEYLSMKGNFIQGSIPQSFINLEGIKQIDLSRNNLSGKIPEFLETFRSLQYLNLSFNDLEGEVPKSGVFANASELYILGNKRLCGGDPMLKLPSCDILSTYRSKRSQILITVIPTVSVVIISLFCLFGILYQQRKVAKVDACLSSPMDEHRKLSYFDILKATEGFSLANLIGSGSFGSVYKGIMGIERKIVAVKVLHLHQTGAFKSFAAECAVLRNIRHRNLIKILNVCSGVDSMGKDFKALVFEYMPNGSLDKWLHPQASESNQPKKLNLIQRLNIAIDVASALDYLHHNCVPQVVHCDIKPSNVLLDNDMTAHVGDFGLARWLSGSISKSKNSTSLTGIKGSIGYVAPEYGIGSKISTQGDAYSYGVLLLEMLTGMKPTDDMFKDGLDLHKYVGMAFPDRIMGTLDPQIVQEDVEEARANNINRIIDRSRIWRCILSLIRIGLSCSQESPSERMDMRDVSLSLLAIKEQLLSVEAHEDATK